MRKMAILMIALGIGLGWLLSFIVPDLGGLGLNLRSPTNATAPQTDEKPPETIPEEPTEEPAGSGIVEPYVSVLIDGRDYLRRVEDDGDKPRYEPASLDEIVDAAKLASGDEDGLRVRITCRRNARQTAEIALRDRLLEAGISNEAIRQDIDPVP